MKVTKIDKYLFLKKRNNNVFSIKEKANDWIIFANSDGDNLILLSEKFGCGPNYICVDSLEQGNFLYDNWVLENDSFSVPQKITLNLKNIEQFNSSNRISLRDYPGRVKRTIAKRLKNDDCSFITPVSNAIDNMLSSIKKHNFINEVEIPNVFSKGINNVYSVSEAAVIGVASAVKCFSAGSCFKHNEDKQILMTLRNSLKYAGDKGKFGLLCAFEGRATEVQQKLFVSMKNDNEIEAEKTIVELEKDPFSFAPAFLAGVNSALEFVKEIMF